MKLCTLDLDRYGDTYHQYFLHDMEYPRGCEWLRPDKDYLRLSLGRSTVDPLVWDSLESTHMLISRLPQTPACMGLRIIGFAPVTPLCYYNERGLFR